MTFMTCSISLFEFTNFVFPKPKFLGSLNPYSKIFESLVLDPASSADTAALKLLVQF